MTDQIPADKVREIAAAMRAAMRRGTHAYSDGRFLSDMSGYITDLEALLPTPPPPTLADMTYEERAECQWMQADIIVGHDPLVITHIDRGDGAALILDRNGRYDRVPADEVTPRPDLPRFVWPGTEKPAPALPKGWRLADHKDDGRVVVTNPIPASDGRVYYVMPNPGGDTGYDWLWCDPDELTYLDQGTDQ